MQGAIWNYVPTRLMYVFCPLSKCFDVEESSSIIVPHGYIQPIQVQILEYIHNTKYNRKLYKPVQITLHEVSLNSEDHKIIRALELLWLRLQTKYVILVLATLLTSSDTVRTIFPNGFFADDDPLKVLWSIWTKKLHKLLTILLKCLNFLFKIPPLNHLKQMKIKKIVNSFLNFLNSFWQLQYLIKAVREFPLTQQ